MKLLFVVSVLISATFVDSEKYECTSGKDCPDGECCILISPDYRSPITTHCVELVDKGEKCHLNYTESYQEGIWYRACPCEEGTYCSDREKCTSP